MSQLGDVVYYKTTEAPSRYYPALVTNDGGRAHGLDLAVFMQEGVVFPLGVRHGQPGEPGCWRAEEPEEPAAPAVESILIVQMPVASARDELATMAELSASRERVEAAAVVIAVWPDATFEVVKRRGSHLPVEVVPGRSTPHEEANPGLEAGHFASAFMTRYGGQRQSISEEVMAEWFGAAMRGEHFPRARA